jgi:hypothetical protein
MVTWHRRLPAKTRHCRRVVIVWALREGYDPAKGTIHHKSVATQAIMRWVKTRMSGISDYLDGMVKPGAYISTYGSGDRGVVTPEPAVEFTGWISTTFLADMADEDAGDMVSDWRPTSASNLVRNEFASRSWTKHGT